MAETETGAQAAEVSAISHDEPALALEEENEAPVVAAAVTPASLRDGRR